MGRMKVFSTSPGAVLLEPIAGEERMKRRAPEYPGGSLFRNVTVQVAGPSEATAPTSAITQHQN